MPATTGFQLVPSDLSILQHVHELRLATIEHLAALSGRSYKRTQERLVRLEEHRYLTCIARRPHKHVYTIGREGVPVLIEHGYASRELADRRLRTHELKELGIRHAVFIADIHVKLLQLTREKSIAIANWVEGPSLWDTVTTSNNVMIPIRPDAWLTIGSPQGRAHFFLEADRGTMAHSRMRDKITGYAAYFQQQRHVKKYTDMKVFRVATITETRGRANGLASEFRAMMSPAWLSAYPVIAFEDLTLEALMPELAQASKT
jgi:protein involved in plasmid replication-relaxation